MILNELYLKCKDILIDNNIEDADFETKVLIKHHLDINESAFFLNRADIVPKEKVGAILNSVKRRVKGEPIQYVIGEWDFFGLTYKVGKGVLIPRPETEILCELIINKAKELKNPVIFDLCTGSGCIGITIKNNVPDSQIYMVDKSQEALAYQSQNVNINCKGLKTNTVCADIFDIDTFTDFPKADIIVSNPPYIRSDEIPTLQNEVQLEPSMALDGGEDGLIFYRQIISVWKSMLNNNGIIAFECAENQSDDIEIIFRNNGFDTEVIQDYNHINRFVIGRRNCDAV